jgi:glycosyltransferase involved in cell wall biosynthesis
MPKIAVLLNGKIQNDSRVIKIIKTLSKQHQVDLFYINGSSQDDLIFKDMTVRLFSCTHQDTFFVKLLRHTFFYNEFMFFKKAVLKNNIRYDYIYANDLPCLKPAVALKKRMNAKLIYDSHEIYNETLNQFFPSKPSFFKKPLFNLSLSLMRFLGEREERYLLKSVDNFITVGEGLKMYFSKKYGYEDIKVVMNCPPLSFTTKKVVNLQKLLKINPEQFIVLYQGVLNQGRGLEILIRSFTDINKNIVLVILGSGPLLEYLRNLTNTLGLHNQVYFHKRVSPSELVEYTKGANVGISLLEDLNLSKKYAAPNKLFEYLHAEVPVICNAAFETESVFRKFKIGKLIKENCSDLAMTINTISKENLDQYKTACKKAAQEYCWENQERILSNLIK